ncbi:uncharacterized protein N7515_010216 [Penicillium bovifimosum]|uniref:Uncharacterized protein n=1 Tax=Penicillium bovifimosum TaxID=126998 RepID=A0A9W9GHY8_9EURO|nr:uncharacterized protein N7515_010216 [Penicillium bovifimosum]KAJ5120828.1 hypothetical protein N7515_010216 [Penicillium bovifimosum]
MDDPNSEGISCEVLSTAHDLSEADIGERPIMVEIMEFWNMQLQIPTAQGDLPFIAGGEGQMVQMTIHGNALRCSDDNKEWLPGVFHTSCVLQAIMQNPRIGGVWIIR